MSKILVIAEKPELARSIARAIGQGGEENDGLYEDQKYQIISAYGHLLQLKDPEDYDEKYKDRTNIDLLPIYFKSWQKIPTKDKIYKSNKKQDNSYIRKRLQKIGDLLSKTDTVIHAGDPDDEGQLLIDEILDYFQFHGKVYRVLLNDNLEENIRKEFNKPLEDNRKYRPIGNAAYARQMGDMCFGINHSRLASIRLGKHLTIGRVQTPTLNLVVTRDKEISEHEKRNYYDLTANMSIGNKDALFTFKPRKELCEDEKHVYDRNVLEKIKQKETKQTVSNIKFETKIQETHPPLPYNATELQADMNGRYGYSLSETIKITQVLRDKYKAITYNRSDCQYLKEEHFEEAPYVLPVVLKNLKIDVPVDTTIHSRCFDDSKISAHHAIIPQKRKLDLSQMSVKERNVYVAICERYMMQFLPPVKKNICKGVWEDLCQQGTWEYTSSYVLEPGYTAYFDKPKEEPKIESFFNRGTYSGTIKTMEILEKQTKPLPRYTPKTLIKDMCGISKYVKDPEMKKALKAKDDGKEGENGSIGTVATRGDIVDKLIKNGFLEMKGKSIVSTQLGREFCNLLPEDIKSPDTTAKWWLVQEQVKKGENPNYLMQVVVQDFRRHKDTDYLNASLSKQAKDGKESFGKCPCCGKDIYKSKSKKTNKNVYYCSGYKEGCQFSLYEDYKRFNDTIHLTDGKVKKLLSGETINEELTKKDGGTYTAKLKLETKQLNGKVYTNLNVDGYVRKKKKAEG